MSVTWTIAQLERNTSELDAEAIEASIAAGNGYTAS